MKTMAFIVALVTMGLSGEAQSQVLVAALRIDTTIYELSSLEQFVYPGPGVQYSRFNDVDVGMEVFACRKIGTRQVDLFSFTGKVGEIILPAVYSDENPGTFLISQTFIDNDDGWEFIYHYIKKDSETSSVSVFSVFDDDNTVLLSDTGGAMYGFDGNSTYVFTRGEPWYHTQKIWRFRTNVSSASSPALSKSAASGKMSFMAYGPTAGNYRVRLEPSGNGATSMQLIDMLGRCVFSRQFGNITEPLTFTIPENSMPRTPFVARVQDGKESYVKREIPVR